MGSAFTPSKSHLANRSLASVRADVAAFEAWVAQLIDDPSRRLRTKTRANYVVLSEIVNGKDLLIVRVVLREGRWHLQWARQNDRWLDYDEKSYLTLAIPMRLIEENPYGVFWG